MQDLTQGTVGSFCVRCHSPVGTQYAFRHPLPHWMFHRSFAKGSLALLAIECKKQSGELMVIGGLNQETFMRDHRWQQRCRRNAALADAAQLKLKLSPGEPGPANRCTGTVAHSSRFARVTSVLRVIKSPCTLGSGLKSFMPNTVQDLRTPKVSLVNNVTWAPSR